MTSASVPINPKQIAAERAAAHVQDGMTVGLGTGSTTAFAIAALGQRMRDEHLRLHCLATSEASATLARTHGLTVQEWDNATRFDITIDGADEVDPAFRLIKGGGGAHVREKLVAAATTREIIIVDSGKVKTALGAFPLPVAIVPWAWPATLTRLQEAFGCPAILRRLPTGEPFQTDDQLYIADLHFGAPLPDPPQLERDINSTLGVVDCGLFIGLCQHLIIGYADGRIEEKTAPS